MKLIKSLKYLLFVLSLMFAHSLYAADLLGTELTGSDGEKHHLKDYLHRNSLTSESRTRQTQSKEDQSKEGQSKEGQSKQSWNKDNWTVLIVWGPRCPVCIEEMPEMQALYDDRETTHIDVIGLAVDFPSFGDAKLQQVQAFIDDYFISFPNLLISSEIFYQLGLGSLRGTPTTILLDPAGKVSTMQLGKVPRKAIEDYIKKHNS